eukprot:scaffold108838_cov63-Phaeocystis_antarctica.AAC.6
MHVRGGLRVMGPPMGEPPSVRRPRRALQRALHGRALQVRRGLAVLFAQASGHGAACPPESQFRLWRQVELLSEEVDLRVAAVAEAHPISERDVLVQERLMRGPRLATGLLAHEAVELIGDHPSAAHGAHQVAASGAQLQHGVGAQHEDVLVWDPAQATVHTREPIDGRRLQQLLHRVVE